MMYYFPELLVLHVFCQIYHVLHHSWCWLLCNHLQIIDKCSVGWTHEVLEAPSQLLSLLLGHVGPLLGSLCWNASPCGLHYHRGLILSIVVYCHVTGSFLGSMCCHTYPQHCLQVTILSVPLTLCSISLPAALPVGLKPVRILLFGHVHVCGGCEPVLVYVSNFGMTWSQRVLDIVNLGAEGL